MQITKRTKQSIFCPLCKKKASPLMGKLSEYFYCTQCSLGWIKFVPTITYKAEYFTSGSSLLARIYMPIELFFYKLRERYTGFSKKRLYIDIGAGDGKYLKTINAKKKIGVEISDSGRRAMEMNGLETMTNNTFLKTKNLNADVISFWQVLEHVEEPWKYLQAAEKNIKKKGKIIVAVPNVASFEFRLFGKYWFHLAPLYHIWHFSPISLTNMLKNANLKVEKIDFWAIEHHPTGTLQSIINMTTKTEDILHKLIKRRQNLQRLKIQHILWITFWCTLGLPLIVLFWIIASLAEKSGNFVVVASKK